MGAARNLCRDPKISACFSRPHILHMQNKSSKKARFRAEILAEISALPPSVQGTISSYRNVRKNGTAAVYHNLQYTHKGQEPLVRDPDGQGLRVQGRRHRRQEAQGSRLRAFTRRRERNRIVRLPLQKARALRPEGAARIHAVVDAAKDFSAKHAFRISADTVREIVGLHYDAIRDFPKDESRAKEDSRGKAPLVCIMADGTGIPLRKECLKGAKGKDGRAKPREVKAAAIFRASTTSDNEPHRDIGTTSYVATTHRTEKFGNLVRAEFDRRFGQIPETTLYITDGGKWLQTVWSTSTTGPTSAA